MSNRVEESLIKFNKKCAKLDLPPECYPDQQFLRKILRQNLSFFEIFTQKVDTKKDVELIRKNLLIAHMNSSIQDARSASINPKVPMEYKKYIKYNQLMEKINPTQHNSNTGLRHTNQELTEKIKQKLEILERNEVKIAKSKEKLRLQKAKLDLLQAKCLNINERIVKEEELQKKIKDITPPKFSSSDNIDDYCKNINESIQVLKEFASSDNGHVREKFWKRIDGLLKKVPNDVMYQVIMKELTSKIDDSCISSVQNATKYQPEKISDKLLPLLYQHKIISAIELMSQKKRLEEKKQVCADTIQVFENDVESLMNASIDYSFQLEEDDVVGDFLSALIAKVNLEGKIQFCTDHVNSMKQQVEANQSATFEYEQLVNDTRNIYGFIDEKIEAVQEHVANIHRLNEKVNFSKISIMRMIQSLKIEKSQQHNRTLLNHMLNNTVIANNKENEVSLPKHEMEIQQFLDMPVHLFDRSLTMKRSLVLNNEDVIAHMMQIFGTISSPHQFLEFLDKRIKFGSAIKSLSHEVPSQIDQIIEINRDDLLEQRDKNSDEISSMIDDISKLNVSISSNLRIINSLYLFALENPLRKFVPKNKKFDGKSYEHFEKEYMLYYKMISH